MSAPAKPLVDCARLHTTLYVTDVVTAVDFYTNKLGFVLGFTWGEPVTIAGVNLGDVQIFLERGTPNPNGCELHFVVGDADELYEFHQANGIEILTPPGDRDYGVRNYAVRDLYGHMLDFGHYIYTVGPPVEVERVDVPVRLEKRLAALLQDLAMHKRMSLTSCLEEIFLHTCEQLGDGVASPHTKSTLRYIQQLKAKHGIDYDCHASYRFIERGSTAGSVEEQKTAITPMLSVRRGASALEFYKTAFGAVELYRVEDAAGKVVAKLAVEAAEFWVADESPEHSNFSPESLNGASARMVITVENPDALFERAIAAGATQVWPVTEEYGWRVGRLVDPFGHHWEIGKPLSPVG